eukprot:TRINITY_DN293_c0_g4_i1.p1 TRINITY_DN293_c0_g4~~TRINITY_DN293_c0_g4_i1.p1  ORF type:complete len:112 (+),score=10.86 TRINITY_DN293_c0_g4_i1:209-544(+)
MYFDAINGEFPQQVYRRCVMITVKLKNLPKSDRSLFKVYDDKLKNTRRTYKKKQIMGNCGVQKVQNHTALVNNNQTMIGDSGGVGKSSLLSRYICRRCIYRRRPSKCWSRF